jgi:hypothetical protein
MKDDRRQLMGALEAQLAFLEAGGYWNANLAPWRAPLIFQDSPTCLRYNRPHETRPCSECVLAPLVPADQISKEFPCRHIPLNEQGETLDSLHGSGQEEVESVVAEWLRAKISELQEGDVPVKAKSASKL